MTKRSVNYESSAISRDVYKQAADWHALMLSGEVTKEEAMACEYWRNDHPDNEAAFQKMNRVFGRLENLSPQVRNTAGSVLTDVLGGQQVPGRYKNRSTLLALPIVLFCAFQFELFNLDPLTADHYTPKGERKSIVLEDGSTLVLNTNSAVSLDYSEGYRQIILERGEIWVDVAPDKQRPFIIKSEQGTAKALGTQYAVSLKHNHMDVVVTESIVEVCGAKQTANFATGPLCTDTREGHKSSIQKGIINGPERVNSTALTAWRQGRLVVNDKPLDQVLTELKRYQPGFLHFKSKKLKDIKVSGVFPLDNVSETLSILSKNLPIQVKYYTPFITVITHQSASETL